MKEEFRFDFENLEVYELSLRFVEKIFSNSGRFGQALQYSLGDQLRRAALSIPNNIAEGSGKKSKKEKIQFYYHALNSARECIPMITICLRLNLVGREMHDEMRQDCLRICKMLGKLIRSVE